MTPIDDLMLMAYADGELDPADRQRVDPGEDPRALRLKLPLVRGALQAPERAHVAPLCRDPLFQLLVSPPAADGF